MASVLALSVLLPNLLIVPFVTSHLEMLQQPLESALYLRVGSTLTRSWVLRYQLRGTRREMGLGSVALVSLAEARQRALEHRKTIARGVDPIDDRARVRTATVKSFGECAAAFIAMQRAGWKNDDQANQWEQSLRVYGPPGETPIDKVDTQVVMAALVSIWTTKTETATRVRGRIERILDWARVSGLRTAVENPARWRGHLDNLLPAPNKVRTVKHHDAMPFADVPAFMVELETRRALAAKALRFTILTAARTGEVTGATWAEFDLDAALWMIPGARMKAGKEHAVPLVPEAVALVTSLPRDKPPFQFSENAMLYLMQRRMGYAFAVHGFRSSFRDWAAETTSFPSEVVEMALAHAIKDKTEAAYRRGSLLAKRRELMSAWAAYCKLPACDQPL